MVDTIENQQSGFWPWMEEIGRRYRLTVNVVIHAMVFAVALLVAYVVRMDAGVPGRSEQNWFAQGYLHWLPCFVIVKILIFGRMKLFRGGWQYTSVSDVSRILMACWVFVLISMTLLIITVWMPQQFGRTPIPYVGTFYVRYHSNGIIILDFFATVFLVCTVRLGLRIYREELRPAPAEGVQEVLIVGAGNAAESIIRETLRMRQERYHVVGLVDDDPNKKHLLIHGVPVLGTTQEIRQICDDEAIDEIIIAIPSATRKQLQRVIELCSGTKLKFQSLPSVGDLIDGKVMVSQIRPVDIDDLLGRETVELDLEAVGRFIRDRRVLITGAGGSIGSEMCRQVCRFQPARLILLEQAETPLFDIENELVKAHPDMAINACICDIYDRKRVFQIWDRYKPEVVIHAAAHKHVPLIERNPCEAIKNNILGTRNVADASREYATAEFVTISTDKAVNPSSVMGVSKRVTEMYTQALNGQPDCTTKFKAVRFGNVLGSAGSVIPTFKKQIAAGGPVTVTHKNMTRYFMTIPEAAQLVLQAAATGEGGQVFLLDMGEPVKIVDLARQMITLSGFRPGEDIDIEFTGIRPGEKLFEELKTAGEDIEPTVHPKVMIWKSNPIEWEVISKAMAELAELRHCPDRDKIVEALKRIVPEYTPLNPPKNGNNAGIEAKGGS